MQTKIKLYHFFAWGNSRGWQHLGYVDGYSTYTDCYEDNEFYIEKRDKWKIMKLVDTKDLPFK
jgi:hypothetical protein